MTFQIHGGAKVLSRRRGAPHPAGAIARIALNNLTASRGLKCLRSSIASTELEQKTCVYVLPAMVSCGMAFTWCYRVCSIQLHIHEQFAVDGLLFHNTRTPQQTPLEDCSYLNENIPNESYPSIFIHTPPPLSLSISLSLYRSVYEDK